MENIIAYLSQQLLVSGILAAYYFIALRNRKHHTFNRTFLLGTLTLSLLLPLMPVNWAPSRLAGTPLLSGSVERIQNISRSADNNNIPWLTISCTAAGIISFILLMVSLIRISSIYRLKTHRAITKMPGYHLIHTDDTRAPFSFLNNLFWQKNTDPNDQINARIYRHELAHIRGRHSWDSLFAQLLCNTCWINPFFWLIRRELKIVHEFIADEATGMSGDAEGFARMLLSSINAGRWLQPQHSFFQSPIKRRLIMLCNITPGRFAGLRKLLVLPVVLAVFLAISCSKKAPATAITMDATDQAKIQKENLDRKIHKLIESEVFKEFKQRQAEAAKAGLSPIEYKQLMEKKLLEAEKGQK